MSRGREKVLLVAALTLIALGAFASAARADDSQIRISEVYLDGTAAHRDFVELQFLGDGQAIPGTGMAGGAAIRLCRPAGPPACVFFDFPADSSLPADLSQRTVVFGWDDNPNVSVDFGIPPNSPAPNLNSFFLAGGDACYFRTADPNPSIPIDCVSWGTSTGTAPSVGNPAPALNGTQSLTRTEARGCPTLMEAVDDSDDSASDFSLATPSPRNNVTTPSEAPCTVPAPAVPQTTTFAKKKCKKKKKARHSAAAAKKKKCKKKKKK